MASVTPAVPERPGKSDQKRNIRALEHLPAGKTLDHLRAVLVAGGMLPTRDERLVKLERWITGTIATRPDPAERHLLHRYAIWHHLRRLRRRLGTAHASHLQALNVRCHTTAAVNFLDWLASRDWPWPPAPNPTWTNGPPAKRSATGTRPATSSAGPPPTGMPPA